MKDKTYSRNLHPELHPQLLQFQGISGELLKSVWHVYDEGDIDKVVLEFDKESLVVEANIHDDTIAFHVIRNKESIKTDWVDASGSEPWVRCIGKEFGWGWITINQQDALDGILLSFDGITPQVMLNVMASSIKESRIIASRA